ncbi:LysR family transcriptional regulator [Rhizobium sp. P40RR-XXII]|uniref:LysR family transcriptional regulator n=1 Tax=unclassified Rhizobium TaxID=2613769 RepID=UPI00145658FF|nr:MULTISPECIES: LysR family transcriptional regulator [unclassified Rhizobium]NLR88306.1 LysR family transcriptional regulator [Rhizobium sp. P28RR-XV]NLS21323.1 LysR family transcriptional regulator [Rhizobium sp. P40RR-XXII]
MNWDDVRLFLAVSRSGTLRGAALELGIDQTTVGRRIGALEQSLGSQLFLRMRTGLILTDGGRDVLAVAENMERMAVSFMRRSEGRDAEIQGEVRVTTTDSLALDFVIPAIDSLRRSYPDVRVVLGTTTRLLDLGRREADVAIRTRRPEQPDLIQRRLATWPVGLFASRSYIERCGLPTPGNGFAGHDIAVYRPGVTERQDETLAGEQRQKGKIVAELDSSLMLQTVIRSGMAIGELPEYVAERDDGLIRVWPEKQRQRPYDVWLALHSDLAATRRVRVVVDAIASAFTARRNVPRE